MKTRITTFKHSRSKTNSSPRLSMKQKPFPKNQQTFAEINGISNVGKLTNNQRRILSLVNCKLTQAQIAKKLKFSPAYICQTIKRLECLNLIKKLETQRTKQGIREYNNFYELSPELKGSIKKDIEQPFSPTRVHHVLRKFKIVNQTAPPSKDKRTAYLKSWSPRGGERYKYWYPGKAGLPSITIDVHPKTIVAYMDKGQSIVARTKEEAEQMAWYALYQAKDKFIEQQSLFGITFEIENVGIQIGKAHGGLVIREDGPWGKDDPVTPGIWKDNSVNKELGPGFCEIEMFNDNPHLTRVEKGLFAIEQLPETIRTAMPEAFADLEKIGPLTSEVHTVLAHIQSGQSVDARVNQLILMFGDVLKQQHKILDVLAKQGARIE